MIQRLRSYHAPIDVFRRSQPLAMAAAAVASTPPDPPIPPQRGYLGTRCGGLIRIALYLMLQMVPLVAWGNILDTEPQTRNSPVIETPEAVKLQQFTGSATYEYRFEIPPGTGGLTPELALSYSTLTKGTEFGWGWTLNLSRIERCTRFGPPSYNDAQDRFEIDGELLVPDPTLPQRFHKTHADFSRIQYFPNSTRERSYWEVITPDGIRMRYGSRLSANSRLTNGTELTGPVFRWALDEVIDARGNSYRIDYDPDFTSGAVGTRNALYVYPKYIRYSFRTGDAEVTPGDPNVAANARRLIVFDWAARGGTGEDIDRPTSLRSGFKIQISRRLVGVRVGITANTDGTFGAGEQVRRYAMSYAAKFSSASADSLRSPPFSELASIQRYGSDDTPFPTAAHQRATKFSYSRPLRPRTGEQLSSVTREFNLPATPEPSGNAIRFLFNTVDTIGGLLDLNGDGVLDRIRTRPATGAREWIVNSSLTGADVRWLWCGSDDPTSCTSVLPTAVADRLTDVGTLSVGGGSTWIVIKSDLIDMDGDGLPDWVSSTQTGNWSFRKNLGDRFGKEQVWSPPSLITSGSSQNAKAYARYINSTLNTTGTYLGWSRMIDIDGDGRPDHVAGDLLDPNSMWFSRNHGCDATLGCGFDTPRPIPGRVAFQPLPQPGPLSVETTRSTGTAGSDPNNVVESVDDIVDMNGDGIPDIVLGNGCIQVGFGLGSGFQRRISGGYDGGSEDCNHPAALAATELVPSNPQPVSPVVWASLLDANGDGIVDLSIVNIANGYRSEPQVALGLGDGTFSSSTFPAEGVPPLGEPIEVRYGNPVVLDTIDFDGDGLVDKVHVIGPIFDGSYLWDVTPGAGPEGLLVGVENELGATTSIQYNQQDNPFPPTGPAVIDPGEPALVPQRRTPWVVSNIAVDDGRAGDSVQTTDLFYLSPRYNFALRENRGFGFVESTDAASTRIDTHYDQHTSARGLPLRADVYASDNHLQKTSSWGWGMSNPRNENGDPIPGAAFPENTTESSSLGSGSSVQVHSISRHFDPEFGFMDQEIDWGADGQKGTGDDLETVATYDPVDTTNWLLRLPRAQYQQLGQSSSSMSRVSDEQRDYANGLLTKRIVLRHDPTTNSTDTLEENWDHDVFGNVLGYWPPSRPRTASAQVATTWDPLTHTFPVAITKQDATASIALTTIYDFSPGLGVVTKSLSPRSYLQCWDYDKFGRLSAKRDSTAPVSAISTDCSASRAQFVFPDATLGNASAQFLTSFNVTSASTSLERREYFDGLGRTYREANQASASDFFVTARSWGNRGELSCQSEPLRTASAGVSAVACGSNGAPSHVTQFDSLLRPITRALRMPSGSGTADRAEESISYSVLNHDGLAGNEVVESHTVYGTPNLQREIGTDPRGAVVSVRELPGDPTFLRRDPKGRITLVDGPDAPRSFQSPEPNLLELTYNSEGQRVRVGRPSSASDPNGPPYSTYSYDVDGNLSLEVPARGSSFAIAYTYDGLDRLRFKDMAPTNSLASPGPSDTVYTYDSSPTYGSLPGELVGISTSGVVTDLKRDLRGNLTQKRRTVGGTTYTLTYYYDTLGRLLGTLYPLGLTVARKYDGSLLTSLHTPSLTSMVTWAQGGGVGALPNPVIDGIAHHASGALQALHFVNGGATTSYTFDPSDYRLSAVSSASSAGSLQNLSYFYDTAGNIQSMSIQWPSASSGPLVQQFLYDSSHRISGVLSSGTYAYPSASFVYDAAGNLTQKGSLTLSYGATGGGPHGVSSAHDGSTGFDASYVYDSDGNVTGRSTTAGDMEGFGYDASNEMTAYSYWDFSGGVGSATYTYDDSGARTSRVAAKTGLPAENTITIDNDYEIDLARGMARRHLFVDGKRALTLETPANAVAPVHQLQTHPDHLGTARLITDETGAVVQRAFNKPFGELYKVVDGGGNDLAPSSRASQYLFTDQHSDIESGLQYFGARYYDPLVGRFLQRDPELVGPYAGVTFRLIAGNSQSLDGYSYALNRPTVAVDRDGRNPALLAGAALSGGGAAIGGGVNLIAQLYRNNWDYHEVNGAELAIAIGTGAVTGGASAFVTSLAEEGVISATTGWVTSMAFNGGVSAVADSASAVVNGRPVFSAGRTALAFGAGSTLAAVGWIAAAKIGDLARVGTISAGQATMLEYSNELTSEVAETAVLGLVDEGGQPCAFCTISTIRRNVPPLMLGLEYGYSRRLDEIGSEIMWQFGQTDILGTGLHEIDLTDPSNWGTDGASGPPPFEE